MLIAERRLREVTKNDYEGLPESLKRAFFTNGKVKDGQKNIVLRR